MAGAGLTTRSMSRAGLAREVRRRLLAGAAAVALLAPGRISAGGLPEPVAEALERHRLPAESLSVWVQDAAAPDEAPLVSHRPDVPRNPASTIKLITTLAALEELGPDYEWETRVYVTGPVRAGRLDGDLVLVGSGDPYLVVEQLWRLLAAVRARGLDTVAGRLVIDNTRFSVAGEPPPGEFDGKPYRAYNAPPDLLVNFNALDVVVESGGGRGEGVDRAAGGGSAAADPARARGGRLRAARPPPPRLPPPRGPVAARRSLARAHRSGTLPARGARARRFRAPCCPRPVSRTGWCVPSGRRWADGSRAGSWSPRFPKGRPLWRRHRSPPLSLVVRGINKFSNNVMSRNLLLTLGAERFGPPGTPDKGRRAVAAWLERKEIEASHLRIVNGAGLSRETRISVRGLGRVLLAGERSRFRPELAASLPLVSIDGTMRTRLLRHPEAARARIKTGRLDGVRAVAGYVRTRRGRTLAVAVLQEYPGIHRAAGATAVQDALLGWLLDRD